MKKTILIFAVLFMLFESPLLFSQRSSNNNLLTRKGKIPIVAMSLNLAGFAMYGPVLQIDFKFKHPFCLTPWIRYSYAGALSTYQWTNFESDSEYDPTSLAVGLELKRFLVTSSRKTYIYYGGAAEFIHDKGLHNIDPDYNYEYEQIRYAIAAYANLGYRFKMGKAFFVNLGIMPGVAFDIKNKGYYTKGASEGLEYDSFEKIKFIGMIECSLGWEVYK
jgi:hypothetical protein